MSQKSQVRRRVVSRGEYVKAQGKKCSIGLVGLFSIGLGMFLYYVMFKALIDEGIKRVDGWVILLVVFFGVSCLSFCGYIGTRLVQRAERIKPGVPLTRANSADIPANESLVRASSQPVQQQKSVLLRAAAGDTQPPDEMVLLRAANNEN